MHNTTEKPVAVLFRYWRGEVIALFPELSGDMKLNTCASFMHIGQHGAANLNGIIRDSRPATPAEYSTLKRELESEPYNYFLQVYQRNQARFDRTRFAELGI